jgi:hypothetical protein
LLEHFCARTDACKHAYLQIRTLASTISRTPAVFHVRSVRGPHVHLHAFLISRINHKPTLARLYACPHASLHAFMLVRKLPRMHVRNLARTTLAYTHGGTHTSLNQCTLARTYVAKHARLCTRLNVSRFARTIVRTQTFTYACTDKVLHASMLTNTHACSQVRLNA